MATVNLGSLPPTATEPAAAQAPVGLSVSSAAAASPAAPLPSPEALLALARQVGDGLKAKSAGLDYHIDMVGGRPRLRVVDAHTGQLVRQFPSDEVLSMSQNMGNASGILLRQKV